MDYSHHLSRVTDALTSFGFNKVRATATPADTGHILAALGSFKGQDYELSVHLPSDATTGQADQLVGLWATSAIESARRLTSGSGPAPKGGQRRSVRRLGAG